MTPHFFRRVLILLCFGAHLHGADIPKAAGEARKLAGDFKFTEGPAWDAKASVLYFSDIPNKNLNRWTEAEGVKTIRNGPQASNGVVIDPQGRIIFCEMGQGRRIVRRDLDGSETTLADSCSGKPLGHPNDLWLAPDGAIYFTIPRINFQRTKDAPLDALHGTVCRISPDGASVTNLDLGWKSPNGIVGSADGRTLIVADPGAQKCWRYRIGADGSLSAPQLAAPKGSDGLALDEHGNLYITVKEGLAVYSPEGGEVTQIAVPESPANMKFGGEDGRTLFVCARTGLYAVAMNVRGDGFQVPRDK